MPISGYFGGHGREVLENMRKQYGPEAESVFYATANKTGQTPAQDAADAHAMLDMILDACDEHLGFEKLEHSLAHKKGVENPRAVAAKIGMEKYGKAGMEKKAAAGRAHDALDVILDLRERRA